jgi:GDP-4-dehydro-6-deoxy-D-mannose reductase
MRARLVTGAAGFAGQHLLRELLREDGRVVGWYRPGAPPPSTTPEGVHWQAVDLRDSAGVDAALAASRPDEIYHLAGAANQGASWQETDVALQLNALATHHLLRAVARRAPSARTLVTTSAAVYAPSAQALGEDAHLQPSSPYGVSKLAQEMAALDAVQLDGLHVVVVRPFNHIGPGQEPAYFAPSFARQLARIEAGLDEPVLRVGNLEAARDLSDVRDVVRAYASLMALGESSGVYNVCRGEAFVIGDLLRELVAMCRVDVRVDTDPARLRPSDVPRLLGTREKVTRATGWVPEVAIARTLEDILDDQRAKVMLDA